MLKRSFSYSLLVLIVLSLVFSACSSTPAQQAPQTIEVTRLVNNTPQVVVEVVTPTAEPRGGDTLHFRLQEDPETLYNVQTISATADGVIGNYLLDRLVYFDKDGQPQGNLAESWTVSEDQKELTFNLRKGIKFQDDTDFNAQAVKFQFDSILDPANASPVLTYMGSLKEVQVVDDYTVKFIFDQPYAPFFVNISTGYGGINSPTAVEKWGAEYGRHPVGTGPYMLEEWLPGSQITLVRNPNYVQNRTDAVNQGAPLAERIVLTVIPEDGTALAALETGEIIASALTADTITRFVGDPNYNVVIDKSAANLMFLEFNTQKAPFDDPQFRIAIGYAINRDSAVQAAWSGYASPALSPLALGIPGFDEEIAQTYGTPYDSEKAKSMLTELGWKDENGDGIIEKDGNPAKFVIKSYSGYTSITRTLEVIQANLKDIGIEVTLETSDWGAFYPSLMEDTWDMDLMRWTWNDAAVLSDLFRSPGHREKLAADPEIDEVLDRCDTTMDTALRTECISEAQKVLLEKMIIVPVQTNWSMYATLKSVQDYTIDFSGYLIPGDVWLQK